MKKLFFKVSVIVIVLLINCEYVKSYAEEVFNWKRIEYENLPLPDNTLIGPYRYHIPENNDIVSAGYHPMSGLMLVTVFRCRPGVPVTVGAFCVKDYKLGSSPKLWGFPNYNLNTLHASDYTGNSADDQLRKVHYRSNKHRKNGIYYSNLHQTSNFSNFSNIQKPLSPAVHKSGESKRIISVYHIQIDEKCNRVFLFDAGLLQYYPNTTYIVQKPALIEISLPSNGCETRSFHITHRSELPDRISSMGHNGFMYITLDYQSEKSCDDLFMYITNPFFSYLIVYHYKKDQYWTYEHESFKPISAESHFVFGQTDHFDMPLGIISVTLGYPDKNGDRTAYYFPFASTAQYAVSTNVLKNSRQSPTNFNPQSFNIMGYRGCGRQAIKGVTDYTHGVIFYAELESTDISCWNMNKPFNPDNIGVIFKSDKIYFNTQIFIDSRGYLWFHSSHVPIDFYSLQPLNMQEVNSRTFRIKISDAIRGTVCE